MSTPITFPSGPTLSAAKKQSKPAPEPKSNTTSPFFKDARAIGFPHPSPRLELSGALPKSSFVYPIFELISFAKSTCPQQLATGAEQQELLVTTFA